MKFFATNLVVFLLIYLKESFSAEPSVIIIGAGPAGIAAAAKLLENDFRKISILEAENRTGGRVNSVFFGEAYVDLGAEWCHGEKDNIVYEMAKNLSVLRHSDTFSIDVYHSSGQYLGDDFSNELVNVMQDCYSADGHKNAEEGRTLGSYCIERFNSSIYRKFSNDSKKIQIARSSMDLFHHVVLSFEGSFSWFEPSAESDYRDCEGDLNLNWNGLGFKTALDILIKKYPDPSKKLPLDDIVLLNKEVTKVFWNQSDGSGNGSGIKVQCSDNTTYNSDIVIFTASVGVLKERHADMFHPNLPENKRDAIRNIGIGAVIKAAMYFENNTWWWRNKDHGDAENFTGFYFVWDERDVRRVLTEFPEGPVKNGRSWVTQLFCILPAVRNPSVLIAWFSGDMVPEIELLPEEVFVGGLQYAMRKFLGNRYNVTRPDSILRSNWYKNPHFRGTYSYQTINARKEKVSPHLELARPLLNADGYPVLQFAGEASHPYFYSTVHGAIETGRREADRILHLYHKRK